MASTITCIPATRNVFTAIPMTSITKRRVAAYARVSTDSDEQFTSYEAQIDYYTKFIQQHEDWTYISVYTDEGISGTNTKKREGFNQMITDALAGKIENRPTKLIQSDYSCRGSHFDFWGSQKFVGGHKIAQGVTPFDYSLKS